MRDHTTDHHTTDHHATGDDGRGHHAGRHLDWAGCVNVRDLGGLRTADGRRTAPGRLVRADALERLTPEGWAAAATFGVQTVVDLRNDDERGTDVARRPPDIETATVPIDDRADTAFWARMRTERREGSPLVFRPFLDAKPARVAEAVTAIARGLDRGAVAYHCRVGRDRTGIITFVLLALCHVEPDEIASDYAHSARRLQPLLDDLGIPREQEIVDSWLASHGLTVTEAIDAALDGFDAAAYLADAGVDQADLGTIRTSLLGAAPAPGRH